jgi:hypothetical protein
MLSHLLIFFLALPVCTACCRSLRWGSSVASASGLRRRSIAERRVLLRGCLPRGRLLPGSQVFMLFLMTRVLRHPLAL